VATVRGLEGAPPADVRAGGTLPTFFGQPNAAVLASATLEPDPGTTTTTALAVADARGIEGYRVMALPGTAPGSPAEISGIAAATLSLTGAPANGAPPTDLTATAIGIDHAVLRGPVNGAVGIDRSTILTGSGNDTVMGRIHSKQTSGLDADGDGLFSSFVFLDASALIGGPGGFDGIRQSLINTGAGDDAVVGAASDSRIETAGGDDAIVLDRARSSSLESGFGDDAIAVLGLAIADSLKGGFGNDTLNGDGRRRQPPRRRLRSGPLDGGDRQNNLPAVERGLGARCLQQRGLRPAAGGSRLLGIAGQPAEAGALGAGRPGAGRPDAGNPRHHQQLRCRPGRRAGAQQHSGLPHPVPLGELGGDLRGPGGPARGARRPPAQRDRRGGGNLAEIRSLGIGSPSLAYATDTRQLLFDADGDWSKGSRSLGTVSMADPDALSKSSIQIGSGA
jgi:hypothetical protein